MKVFIKYRLIYDTNNNAKIDSGTGKFVIGEEVNQKGVKYMYTQNSDSTLTYTATFKTPNGSDPYYYGMNFGAIILDKPVSNSTELEFTKELGMSEQDVNDFRTNLANSFVLEKSKIIKTLNRTIEFYF